MQRTTIFTAKDGTKFETAAACKAYENTTMVINRLVNLTGAQITDALSRQDPGLANAIERAGNLIAKARRAAGEKRRKPSETVMRAQAAILDAMI